MAKVDIKSENSLLLEDFFLLWSNLMFFWLKPKDSSLKLSCTFFNLKVRQKFTVKFIL